MRSFTSEDKVLDTQEVTEQDVLEEQKKALNADPEEYAILTKELRKVYLLDSAQKHKVAVDNLSFGIQKG